MNERSEEGKDGREASEGRVRRGERGETGARPQDVQHALVSKDNLRSPVLTSSLKNTG